MTTASEWVQGAQIKGEAFDGFALGAPKIRTVVLHIVADANQAVAQMLGGVIDVTLASTIRPDEGVIIRDQLGSRGEASLVTIPNKMRHGVFQFRDPGAPWVRDVRPDFSLTSWFSVLVVFVLAEVFREGARLRREAELTI